MRSQKLEPIVAVSAPALLKQFEKLVVRHFVPQKHIRLYSDSHEFISDIEAVAMTGVLQRG